MSILQVAWINGVIPATTGKLAESESVGRTVTDAAVNWRNEFPAALKLGGPRLGFELKGAKLYSFSFGR